MEPVTSPGFGEAVKALLAERRLRLESHCTLEELETYHSAHLSTDRRESIADHLAVCEDCTILLLYGVIEAKDKWPPAQVIGADFEESWNRLLPRFNKRNASKGNSLTSLLGDRRLSLEDALRLALEISHALVTLHAEGRVLPGLRPENVLISPFGEVHLLELGFALTPESLEIGYGQSAEAAMIDLYRSLSPEEVAGEEPDQRSNLFSLGVLLYEILTGISPFRAETPLATASRILSLEPLPLTDFNSAVDPVVAQLVNRLLAKEPEERPPSAASVVQDIESALGLSGLESVSRSAEMDVEAQIEYLYDKLIALAQEPPAAEDSRQADEIERMYAKLLELQIASAERFRDQFEASLAMPIDAGETILARIQALRKELEDFTSSDAATEKADGTQAPAKTS